MEFYIRYMNFPQLNLPLHPLELGKKNDQVFIRDVVQGQWRKYQPEEYVRQQLLQHLIVDLQFPKGLISVEKGLLVNGLKKRYDAVVYNNQQPLLLIECKAPQVPIKQGVFDQAARYNLELNVPFFLLSNGMQQVFCRMDFEAKNYQFLPRIPSYSDLKLLGQG